MKSKPVSDFHKAPQRKDGLRVHCKECIHLWYEAQKERQREKYVLRAFGVTQYFIEEETIKQGGRCAICQRRKKLQVDHDHDTGKYRGMLCGDCNKGLGFFHDSQQYLIMAGMYLEERSAPRQLQSEGNGHDVTSASCVP